MHTTRFHSSVYALLPGKDRELYNKLLDEVLNLIPDDTIHKPASITTHFEEAATDAVTAHFLQADVSGCHFHLGQSARRIIQGLVLATFYREDPALYDYLLSRYTIL